MMIQNDAIKKDKKITENHTKLENNHQMNKTSERLLGKIPIFLLKLEERQSH